MKRSAVLIILFISFCCLLTGCNLWTEGNYHSVKPHLQEGYQPNLNSLEADSYDGLQNTLIGMVDEGRTSGVIYLKEINLQQADGYMDMAIRNVTKSYPLGAYAVNDITYEIGTSSGRNAIAVEITYHHSRAEIMQIQDAVNMTEASLVIAEALNNCEAGVVLQVKQYESTDFIQLVKDYVDANPQHCMEMPQVAANVYPERGAERLVELIFTYQTSRDVLRDMQKKVQPVFDSAKLYVSDEAGEWEKYELLYAFLMERYDYKQETSITPSYSLLHHGVGDCKAFATVYSAMCRQTGLDCRVVSGTRDGSSWYWNVIKSGEKYYFVDLLRCSKAGDFSAKEQNEMKGYVWDYSKY